jgi:heme/copper-type cytochrome/quinol oxidase subunit 4
MQFLEEAKPNPHAFVLLDISERMGPEYVLMFDDFLRMGVIQCTLQLMMYLSNPATTAFLSVEFLLLLIYVMIGVASYWLVFRNLIAFK